MKPIRALSRSLARASFANVLTLAALALGLLLSFIFTAFYFNQAYKAYQHSAHENGVQVAQLISEELANDQTRAIETAMQHSLSGRAELLNPSGEVVHGVMTETARARAESFPLTHDGVELGTLIYAPSQTFTPPIPYWIAALICVGVAIISGLSMRFFALTVVDYLSLIHI